jgi:hypothetical protein
MQSTLTARRTFQMLDNETLWDTATRVNGLLTAGGVDYAVVGGVAVCLHGYRRNTVDLDLLIRSEDSKLFRSTMATAGFTWNAKAKEFHSPSGVAVQVVIAGEPEGPGQQATFPDPKDAGCVTTIEGLPVLSLTQLIQSKIACGLGNLRRTHKDFADVVELIAIHRLDGSFAGKLHKSVRKEFRALVKRAS